MRALLTAAKLLPRDPQACAAVASDDTVCRTCSLVCILCSLVCTPRRCGSIRRKGVYNVCVSLSLSLSLSLSVCVCVFSSILPGMRCCSIHQTHSRTRTRARTHTHYTQVLLAALSSRLCTAPDRAVKAASAATLSAILASAEQHAGGAGKKLSNVL